MPVFEDAYMRDLSEGNEAARTVMKKVVNGDRWITPDRLPEIPMGENALRLFEVLKLRGARIFSLYERVGTRHMLVGLLWAVILHVISRQDLDEIIDGTRTDYKDAYRDAIARLRKLSTWRRTVATQLLEHPPEDEDSHVIRNTSFLLLGYTETDLKIPPERLVATRRLAAGFLATVLQMLNDEHMDAYRCAVAELCNAIDPTRNIASALLEDLRHKVIVHANAGQDNEAKRAYNEAAVEILEFYLHPGYDLREGLYTPRGRALVTHHLELLAQTTYQGHPIASRLGQLADWFSSEKHGEDDRTLENLLIEEARRYNCEADAGVQGDGHELGKGARLTRRTAACLILGIELSTAELTHQLAARKLINKDLRHAAADPSNIPFADKILTYVDELTATPVC